MLIITADDLGFSASRNAAILEAAAFGTVSSASLMVNMPYAEEACRLVKEQVPQLGLGLHFTLTSGRPVATPQEVPLLIDANGMFRHGFVSLWKNAGQPEFFEQIRLEFETQSRLMDKFKKRYELQIDHLDSHQHIHAIRPIWNLLTAAAKHRRWAVRLPREPYGRLSRVVPFRTLLPLGDFKKAVLDFCTWGVHTVPKHLYFGVLDSGKMNRTAWNRILYIVKRYPNIPCEVNVHPGYTVHEEPLCCSRDDRKFHYSHWRQRELDVLLDQEFLETLKKTGVFPLQNWSQVCAGTASENG
jgi:predicted glycoside hydrolase/deacetylase ChbG (UPF0249 family)